MAHVAFTVHELPPSSETSLNSVVAARRGGTKETCWGPNVIKLATSIISCGRY